MPEKYQPSPFIVNHVPLLMDSMLGRNPYEGMMQILEDVPPDSEAAKAWGKFCTEVEAQAKDQQARAHALLQKHGPYIEECHRPRREQLDRSMDEIRKNLPPMELFLGRGWVIKKPNGEQIGKPDLRPQTVNKALADAGTGSYAEPADWETNESDVQIYAPPTEHEMDMLGADQQQKDHLVFRIEKQQGFGL